jgi:hypothetical protein
MAKRKPGELTPKQQRDAEVAAMIRASEQRAFDSLFELRKKAGKVGLSVLIEIAECREAPEAARVSAAKALADGFGELRPEQTVTVRSSDLASLPDDVLRERARALRGE